MPERTREWVLADIRLHPNEHYHDFAGLRECATLEGELCPEIVDAHAHLGLDLRPRRCDVLRGICSCGKTHR